MIFLILKKLNSVLLYIKIRYTQKHTMNIVFYHVDNIYKYGYINSNSEYTNPLVVQFNYSLNHAIIYYTCENSLLLSSIAKFCETMLSKCVMVDIQNCILSSIAKIRLKFSISYNAKELNILTYVGDVSHNILPNFRFNIIKLCNKIFTQIMCDEIKCLSNASAPSNTGVYYKISDKSYILKDHEYYIKYLGKVISHGYIERSADKLVEQHIEKVSKKRKIDDRLGKKDKLDKEDDLDVKEAKITKILYLLEQIKGYEEVIKTTVSERNEMLSKLK